MRILRASIENFRGIRSATIQFPKHGLLVGPNNACKSTVLEALNLVLGPDRVGRPDSIDEHDFFRSDYLPDAPSVSADGDENDSEDDGEGAREEGADAGESAGDSVVPSPTVENDEEEDQAGEGETGGGPEIRIEVTLGDLTPAELQRFRNHVEPWDREEGRVYTAEEAEDLTPDEQDFVLRVFLRGWYEVAEDEFRAKTYYVSPPSADGTPAPFGRTQKRAIGFLYLRSLRTARRAASLERGSLMDILLREHDSHGHLWETMLTGLRETGEALEENTELRAALDEIQGQIEGLIPLADDEGPASGLRPARLTRRHLRQTVTYFLASRDSGVLLPFDQLGSGTSNVLVFALLSAIAEAKDNVIFAMEEPEIALPPHTQRVIVQRLKDMSAQALLSSHSPYVAELFLPNELVILRRDGSGDLQGARPDTGAGVKEKTLRREFRTRFAEGLMARFVILVEGITEFWAIPAAVDVLTGVVDSGFEPPDVDGVVFIPAGGSGSLAPLANYYESLGIPTIILCDQLDEAERTPIENAATLVVEHPYAGFEELVSRELSLDVIRRVSQEWAQWDDYPRHLTIPQDDADDGRWRTYCSDVLKSRKGEAYAARTLSLCTPSELPDSVIDVIARIRHQVDRPPLSDGDPLADFFENRQVGEGHAPPAG